MTNNVTLESIRTLESLRILMGPYESSLILMRPSVSLWVLSGSYPSL